MTRGFQVGNLLGALPVSPARQFPRATVIGPDNLWQPIKLLGRDGVSEEKKKTIGSMFGTCTTATTTVLLILLGIRAAVSTVDRAPEGFNGLDCPVTFSVKAPHSAMGPVLLHLCSTYPLIVVVDNVISTGEAQEIIRSARLDEVHQNHPRHPAPAPGQLPLLGSDRVFSTATKDFRYFPLKEMVLSFLQDVVKDMGLDEEEASRRVQEFLVQDSGKVDTPEHSPALGPPRRVWIDGLTRFPVARQLANPVVETLSTVMYQVLEGLVSTLEGDKDDDAQQTESLTVREDQELGAAALRGAPSWLHPLMMRCLRHPEVMQVARYKEGAGHKMHVDFEEDQPSSDRALSFLTYLTSPDQGGETVFPLLRFDPRTSMWVPRDAGDQREVALDTACTSSSQSRGLVVKPRVGRALVFVSAEPKGGEAGDSLSQWVSNPHSLHASCPVLWGATDNNDAQTCQKIVGQRWFHFNSL